MQWCSRNPSPLWLRMLHVESTVLLYAETLGSPRSSLPASKEFGSRREGRATSCSTWRSRLGHHPLRRLRCSRGVSFQGTCRCAGSQPCTNEALESVRQWCSLGTQFVGSWCSPLSVYCTLSYTQTLDKSSNWSIIPLGWKPN